MRRSPRDAARCDAIAHAGFKALRDVGAQPLELRMPPALVSGVQMTSPSHPVTIWRSTHATVAT